MSPDIFPRSESKFQKLRQWLLAALSHPLARLAAIAFLFGLALILIMDWILMPLFTRHNEEYEMPNITKMRFEDAKQPLKEGDFVLIKEEERHSDELPDGYIMEQSPAPHTKVKSGRRVYVAVSRGERRVFMPNLIERSQRDAELIISSRRLTLGDVSYQHSGLHPEGVVVAQSVPENAEVSPNTRVNLVVSMGMETTGNAVVPAVEGRMFKDALQMIKQAGLQIGQITYTFAPSLLPETVIHQSVPGENQVSRGTAIDLEVSRTTDENGGDQ